MYLRRRLYLKVEREGSRRGLDHVSHRCLREAAHVHFVDAHHERPHTYAQCLRLGTRIHSLDAGGPAPRLAQQNPNWTVV